MIMGMEKEYCAALQQNPELDISLEFAVLRKFLFDNDKVEEKDRETVLQYLKAYGNRKCLEEKFNSGAMG